MNDTTDKLYDLLNSVPVTNENEKLLKEIKKQIEQKDFISALENIKLLKDQQKEETSSKEVNKTRLHKPETNKATKVEETYPKELSNVELEHRYMGLLLSNPKYIVKYYFPFDNCFFEDSEILNIYKSVLYTEGAAYSSEEAKQGFNFSRDSQAVYELKIKLKEQAKNTHISMEKIFIELQKLFALRKVYLKIPIESMQQKIVEITNYELYDQMSTQEVKDAITQVTVTNKFKQSILNVGLTQFLEEGNNSLTNGISLPFPILSSVFKGLRKGETMAYAMPSNSGKSRFTINLAAYTAFIHKKKVLIISNEMSEEKMKLCLITTILNQPELQNIHGNHLHKTEGEILEFKFRPDKGKKAKIDKDGFVLREKNESQQDFVKRLSTVSTEFLQTIAATDWVNNQLNNSIYFININYHTNDELQKVIINYYYKEKIEYIFYDTLKTDTANIGIGEELKKTATILSNLAQNFNIFICSTLQLAETETLPINLTINDLAVSRTVKEVLDTLCLIKQIHRDNYTDYEYSQKEIDTTFYNLEKFDDPDVRYYACVVDKNRAGAKPKTLFRLNLAYNNWEELGYLRLKQKHSH